MRSLRLANTVLLGLLLLHTMDHTYRQTDVDVPGGATLLGAIGIIAVIVAAGLAFSNSRFAPEATAIVGFGVAIGFVLVHVVPEWGPFSQPYSDIGADSVSWAGVIVTVVVAAWVGTVGVLSRGARPSPAT